MRTRRTLIILASVLAMVLALTAVGSACTILAVGKNATVDGSAIITHNDDSSVADFRLWILEGGEHKEGETRPIVIDSHDYIDYSNWPEVEYSKNRNGRAMVLAEIPQPAKTYTYFHSRYSFINEMGVAMGESTTSISTSGRGRDIRAKMYDTDEGILDCWNLQDIALERSATAREAVQIMGDLINEYGWNVTGGGGELINITDGDETWVMEFFGAKIWVATRVPDDMVWVGANSHRFNIDPRNPVENGVTYEIITSPNFISYAVENGWYDPNSGLPFRATEVYANRIGSHNKREWRAFDLMAPSLKLEDNLPEYPYCIKPDHLLTVMEIFQISGDHYEGTQYDLTKGPLAGPFGNPLANYGYGSRPRPIGIPLTAYLQVSQVKPGLPSPFKGIVWYGYGSVGHSFLTPLFPAMGKLPDLYSVGSRYEIFRRDSGWWINTYVQEMVGLHYNEAIKDLKALRDPKMDKVFKQTAALQQAATAMYAADPEGAVAMLAEYCYNTSIGWYADWLKLGDQLFAKYAAERINFGSGKFPTWWTNEWANPAVNTELKKYAGK